MSIVRDIIYQLFRFSEYGNWGEGGRVGRACREKREIKPLNSFNRILLCNTTQFILQYIHLPTISTTKKHPIWFNTTKQQQQQQKNNIQLFYSARIKTTGIIYIFHWHRWATTKAHDAAVWASTYLNKN